MTTYYYLMARDVYDNTIEYVGKFDEYDTAAFKESARIFDESDSAYGKILKFFVQKMVEID